VAAGRWRHVACGVMGVLMRQVTPFALAAAGFLLLPTLQGRVPLAFNLLITNLRRQSGHRRARCRHRWPTFVQVCCNLQFGS